MLDILKKLDAAEKGEIKSGSADKGSMKAILESIQSIEECGDMPMEMPTAQSQGQPVTVSVTASGKDNVADLIALMQQAAGIDKHVDMPMAHDAHIDQGSHNMDIEMPGADQEMDMATMRQIMAAGEKDGKLDLDVDGDNQPDLDTEEWDNSPDEEYKDDTYMIKDISGGLNRQKPKGSERAKDPAVESIKEQLLQALAEKKMSKKKTDAEVDEGEKHGNSKEYDDCWDGYERVPGTTRGEKGSCRKK